MLFVHLSDVDSAGHRSGWMSAEYGRAVMRADRAVDRLMTLAANAFGPGHFATIVTADHGGHGNDHGSDDPRDVTIPWIAWGQGVKPGILPPSTLQTMDTAATVLWLLGLDHPEDWTGQAVVDAFTATAVS